MMQTGREKDRQAGRRVSYARSVCMIYVTFVCKMAKPHASRRHFKKRRLWTCIGDLSHAKLLDADGAKWH